MKYYRIKIFLRLLLLTGLLGLLCYFLIVTHHYLRSFYLLIFIFLTIWELYYFLNRINRDISVFLLSIMEDDFTTTFNAKYKGRSYHHLYQSFNEITRKFREVSGDRVAQHNYLHALVAHLQVGIISYDEEERIQLTNEAFYQLINRRGIIRLADLGKVSSTLLHEIRSMKPGHTRMVTVMIAGQSRSLHVQCTGFRVPAGNYRLISLENIRQELDTHEIEAWQKLIRVLTHEIMNSVSPISSLSHSLLDIARRKKLAGEMKEPDIDQFISGLDAIRNRSDGLRSFTSDYRTLTKIPPPKWQNVQLIDLFNRIRRLLESEGTGVIIDLVSHDPVICLGDPELLTQAFINVIKNAVEATKKDERPEIGILLEKKGEQCCILIKDHGTGIPQNKLDEIFIPFFTTKKYGSGIGLAVTRQIIQMHHGQIDVHSEEGGGTEFTIRL